MLLNVPSSLSGTVGNSGADTTTNWQAAYIQDNWQASKKLNIQTGLRYDLVPPLNWKGNQVSGWNPECPSGGQAAATQGQINSIIESCFLIAVPFVQTPTAANPSPPSWPFPNVRQTYFDPKYNGAQPRFGLAYAATPKTVLRGAFAIFDDHDNTLLQEGTDPRIRWPFSSGISEGSLNLGILTTFFNDLTAAASFFASGDFDSRHRLRCGSETEDPLLDGIQLSDPAPSHTQHYIHG